MSQDLWKRRRRREGTSDTNKQRHQRELSLILWEEQSLGRGDALVLFLHPKDQSMVAPWWCRRWGAPAWAQHHILAKCSHSKLLHKEQGRCLSYTSFGKNTLRWPQACRSGSLGGFGVSLKQDVPHLGRKDMLTHWHWGDPDHLGTGTSGCLLEGLRHLIRSGFCCLHQVSKHPT